MDLIEQVELEELAEVFFSFFSSSSTLDDEPFLLDFSFFPQDSLLDIFKSGAGGGGGGHLGRPGRGEGTPRGRDPEPDARWEM